MNRLLPSDRRPPRGGERFRIVESGTKILMACGLLLATACATNTTNLERRPGGPAGEATPPVGAPDAARMDGSTNQDTPGETVAPAPPAPPPPPPVDDEPQGQWALTLLHAVVDAERLAFCLIEVDANGDAAVYPQAIPDERGLRFGQSLVLDRPRGLELTQHELQLVAVRLEPGSTPGSCAQWLADHDGLPWPSSTTQWSWTVVGPGVTTERSADGGLDAGLPDDGGALDAGTWEMNGSNAINDAGPFEDAALPGPDASDLGASGTVVRRLVRWPAGSLAGEYSYLLAASGCFSGYGELSQRVAACGEAAARQGSSLTGRFTRLSRKRRFDSLSLQGFNASAAHPEIGLRSIPGEQADGLYFVLADGLASGQALPSNAVRGIGVADLGTDLEQVVLEIYGSSGQVLETFRWGDVFAQSPAEALNNAQPVVLVFLGAPSDSAPAWANRAASILLFSDPQPVLAGD